MSRTPIITVDETLQLQPMSLTHAPLLIDLVNRNRAHLKAWLPWVDAMQTAQDFERFIAGAHHREDEGTERSWIILQQGEVAGRIGIHYINQQNSYGSIGYWLGEEYEGKGLITRACKSIIQYGFGELGLNRLELKCGTGNERSAAIPQRLGFTKEGTLREAEKVGGRFIDLALFSLLRHEWNEQLKSALGEK